MRNPGRNPDPPSASARVVPRSFLASEPAPRRYLTPADCEALFARVARLARDGDTSLSVASSWSGTTRWVRNAIIASTDRVDHVVTVTRVVRGARGSATTNQLDDDSLATAVAVAERQVLRQSENLDADFVSGPRRYPTPDLFKPVTYDLLAAGRSAAARALVEPAAARGVLAAGCLEARADAVAAYDTRGLASHAVATSARYAVTVRDPGGTASGWGAADDEDWARIDAAAVSARALEKCLASAGPVAVEPGRYTVILEPQAVHEFVRVALDKQLFIRLDNEKYDSLPYNLRRAPRRGRGTARFGMQLVDERITIGTDPMDSEAGYLPFDPWGLPYAKVTWIDQGVLRELPYDLDYALELLGTAVPRPYTPAYRMAGGGTSLEEMISTTRRGLLVTRFANVGLLHARSVLATGTTADGTWLVENGKISKPVKNLRFNMSPLAALNAVEQLGPARRVYSPGAPAVVPPLKLREFNFTSLANAI